MSKLRLGFLVFSSCLIACQPEEFEEDNAVVTQRVDAQEAVADRWEVYCRINPLKCPKPRQ